MKESNIRLKERIEEVENLMGGKEEEVEEWRIVVEKKEEERVRC